MLAFSLGTLPSLAGIGAISSFTKGDFKRYFMTFSAIIVIVLGFYNLGTGLTLVGAVVADTQNNVVAQVEQNEVQQNVQVVNLQVRGVDYYPDSFTIQQNIPVQWNIDGRQASGCAKIISVPSLGITQRLSSDGITMVEFTPTKTGKIQFSCSMGMAGPGQFEVVP